ncbi:glycosyltransferase [Methylobacterium sp. NI91]|nr:MULTISPECIES: glycosyltransferase family 4 protein [unclassified Methylobacterium]QIJ73325.1 glycosyltransferase [Methylobacterium sp. CLZ]QIJ78229.1 glycosyltransferase [Methylobacterium sp. NI91]
MRILLLTQFYPPIIGGEERHVRNLGAALAARGHTVSVATNWLPGEPAVERDGRVEVHRLRGTLHRMERLHTDPQRQHAPPVPDPEMTLALRQLVDEVRPDIVHAHNWIYASYLPLKRPRGPRLVVSLHDYSLVCAKKNYMHRATHLCDGPGLTKCPPCSSQHYGAAKGALVALGTRGLRAAAFRTVDRWIPVSRAVARYSGLERSGMPHEVIPNFVPDDVASCPGGDAPELKKLPESFILFVGDMMRLKGVHTLLEAYCRLPNAPPLVLLGRRTADTPDEIPCNVHLLGPWPHPAIMEAWRRCLFGVLPSTGPEACATVIMEAMACGKTLVASDIGGMPDLVDHGETGLLVPPGDATRLAQAMRQIIEDPALRQRLQANGLKRVEQLKASAIVSRIERVYTEVLSAPAAAPVTARA